MTATTRRRRSSRHCMLFHLFAVLGLLAAACSSGGDADPATETTGATSTDDTAAPADDGDDGGAEPADAAADAPAELGPGVTEDTITIGYNYFNLDDLREQGVIDLNHGPYPEHLQTMIDHINAGGGINGRDLEVIVTSFDPINAESTQAACLELTEDNEVFAVLGALRGDSVLCYTEQHATAAIANSGMTAERIGRAAAPYLAIDAAQETKIAAFVDVAVERDLFSGRTLAVHSTDSVATTRDVVLPALADAGVNVEFESLIQGDGTVGGAAQEVTINVESMRARGVDAVLISGDAIVVINTFIGEGFFPALYFLEQGSAHAVALRSDLSAFPEIYAFGGFTDVSRFEEPAFQDDCAAIWNAAHPDDPVLNPNDVAVGDPNHVVGLGNVCRGLTIFTAVAEAAGPNLNYDTFAAAIDGVGDFVLPGMGSASLGPDKHSAQDDLRLWVHDPANSDSDTGFVEIGS